MARVFVFTLLILMVSSCTPKPPYEVRSPCVSIDSDNPFYRSPCSRVPLNGRDIA